MISIIGWTARNKRTGKDVVGTVVAVQYSTVDGERDWRILVVDDYGHLQDYSHTDITVES